MSPTAWFVIGAGVLAIIGINWWFFFAEAPSAHAAGTRGQVAQVRVRIEGGYSPSTIYVKSGQAVQLILDRQETNSCSEEIVIPEFGVRRFLPPFEQTTITIKPEKPGTYDFMCGMSMLHGRIIAE